MSEREDFDSDDILTDYILRLLGHKTFSKSLFAVAGDQATICAYSVGLFGEIGREDG